MLSLDAVIYVRNEDYLLISEMNVYQEQRHAYKIVRSSMCIRPSDNGQIILRPSHCKRFALHRFHLILYNRLCMQFNGSQMYIHV